MEPNGTNGNGNGKLISEKINQALSDEKSKLNKHLNTILLSVLITMGGFIFHKCEKWFISLSNKIDKIGVELIIHEIESTKINTRQDQQILHNSEKIKRNEEKN